MKNIKYYFLIAAVFAAAAGAFYLTVLFDYFYISGFDTNECAAWFNGHDDTVEKINLRLLYASLSNILLIAAIFTALKFSLRLVTSKSNLISLIICVIVSMLLVQTICDGRASGIQTVKRCTHFGSLFIPNIEGSEPLILPSDLTLVLR